MADGEDLLGDRNLDDLERGREKEGHGRFLQGNDKDVEMGAQVAQAAEVLAERGGDGPVGGGGCEIGGHANLREQRRREQEGKGVEYEGRVHAEYAGEEPAQRRAEGEHHRPGGGAERVDGAELARVGDVGQDGGMGRIEKSAHGHLHGCQCVEEPDVAGVADEQEGEDDGRSNKVGGDQDVFAVVAVGDDAGDRADEEGREHAHDEERANRQTRLRQHSDERGRGDEVEPVAEETDDLAEPEIAEIAIVAE